MVARGVIDEADLRRLTAGRWLVPLMAHLGDTDGSRFAVMLAGLGLSRGMLSAGLAQLQEAGWIRRNPGHGHPLRPEYVLTESGAPIAAFCSRVMAQRARLGLGSSELPRWSLPVIGRLDRERARFSGLLAQLAPVTPRALSLTLKRMLAVELVERRLEDGFPPSTLYGLTGRGRRLAATMR
jgi:DNA-binding HxlR family transcriptional regulator